MRVTQVAEDSLVIKENKARLVSLVAKVYKGIKVHRAIKEIKDSLVVVDCKESKVTQVAKVFQENSLL